MSKCPILQYKFSLSDYYITFLWLGLGTDGVKSVVWLPYTLYTGYGPQPF